MIDELTATDAHHLARYLAGAAILDTDALSTDKARAIAGALLSANGSGRAAALDAWLAMQPSVEAESIRRELLDVDPAAPPPDPPSNAEPSAVPALPAEAAVDPANGKGAGALLDTYISYAGGISPMTPRIFLEAGGLVLGSTAIARRLKVPMAFGDVYPNLAAICIAETTLYRKSTGHDVAERLARELFPHLLAPQDMTVEAFLSDLAGCEPTGLDKLPDQERDAWQQERDFAAQRGLFLDEMSGLLASAGRDYNGGLVEAFLRLYDCAGVFTRSTRGQGRVTVRNAYLAMLGASTPSALAPHLLSERLWAMGWWPRLALLTPTTRPVWKVAGAMPNAEQVTAGFQALLAHLPAARWPDPPTALTVTLGDGVFEAWSRYAKATSYDLLTASLDPRLYGTYGRLGVQVLKVGTIFAAFDWALAQEPASTPSIALSHLTRAVGIVESWRASAHRALRLVTHGARDALHARIRSHAAKTGERGITMRDLCRAMRDKEPEDIQRAVQQMALGGDLDELEPPQGEPGRPTTRYRVPGPWR
jgi:hypothetical protein